MAERRTVTATVHTIRAMGLACIWSHTFKEYRITVRGLSPAKAESLAYYTNDADDAIATATTMIRHTACSTDLALDNAAN